MFSAKEDHQFSVAHAESLETTIRHSRNYANHVVIYESFMNREGNQKYISDSFAELESVCVYLPGLPQILKGVCDIPKA